MAVISAMSRQVSEEPPSARHPGAASARIIRRHAEARDQARDDRTLLAGDFDVLICGASFAGLAVARELAGSGARVLMIDRYEVGERQTSACGIPTAWLRAMALEESDQPDLRRAARAHAARQRPLAAALDVLDLRLPHAVRAAARSSRRRRRSRRRRSTAAPATSCTPTAATCARRSSSTRWAGGASSAPATTSSRPRRSSRAASRSTPTGAGRTSSCGSIRSYVRARLRLELPRRRRDARRGRLLRPAAATSRSRPSGWRTTSACRRPLPGQLDPAPHPPADRGRRVLRRRHRRPLPAPRPPRGSAPRCTSASRAAASCGPWSTAGARRPTP